MVDQFINLEIIIGTGNNKIYLYGTKLNAQLHLPPSQAAMIKVNAIPPKEDKWINKLNGTFYQGKRMIVRQNGQAICHASIYSISRNEDREYEITGHNAVKNLKRNSMSASYENASSRQIIRDAAKQARQVRGDGRAAVKFFLPDARAGNQSGQYIQPDNEGNDPTIDFNITKDFEKTPCDQVVEEVCERNEWQWFIDRKDFICVGTIEEMRAANTGPQLRNLYNIVEVTEGLQQPSWRQVVVYGGKEVQGQDSVSKGDTQDSDTSAEDNYSDFTSPQDTGSTPGAPTDPEQKGNPQDKSGQNPDGSDTNSGAENNNDTFGPSKEPVIGRAYLGKVDHDDNKKTDKREGIIKGDPPGSEAGDDIDQNDSGSASDESDEQETRQNQGNKQKGAGKSLAGPKPVYQWTDNSVHTQEEADNMASQILRSFWTKRKSGKITLVGRQDILPMDVVTLPPHDELKQPDLGGNSFLATDVTHNVDGGDGPYKTIVKVGGRIYKTKGRSPKDNNNKKNNDGTASTPEANQ